MQDRPITMMDEPPSSVKPEKKKKPVKQKAAVVEDKGDSTGGKEASNLSKRPRKRYKPILQSGVSPSDSLLDPSGSSDEYRALRHKYLLLEEENFSLDRELDEVDADVKALEDEKLALLDQLVVLEGLVQPSEIKRQL
ncbi:uncharacterized protein LOC122050978 [Zingiber officinale]|uniref:Uncharacterized protein n=1 Tax=Zingiber officinale TaxID=94328 RepID=A0A8J5LNG0_ZINOF|nr:uncharacterized protein LOC122050978 [Zingiber officinale]KAG6519930.1 hypothetical protein ZIOFF_016959 [Zingiber officinale]